MNMLNRNCKISFVKPEFLKKAQRENPRLYDIGCYNDNLDLMLAPESDETIRLAQESRSKLSDLIRPFDYEKLNNLYDLFVPKHEKSPEQRYFSEREYYYADHMNAILGVYTTLDEFIDLQCDYVDQVVKCERVEKELSKSKTMSKSFEALQKHAINLELTLQQYLKAQLQDKEIAISELKKLIEKLKGKSVETKFEKPLVIQQPNAFKSQRQLVLGVIPTTSVSRPQLKRNRLEDRVMHNNSEGKKQQVEDHRNESRTATILKPMTPRCSKHMTGNLKLLTNFVEKFLGTGKFRNDQIAPILGSRGTDLYSITIQDTSTPNPICLMAKATSSQACLSPIPQSQENVPQAAEIVTTSNELDLLFSLMFDELLNGTQVVSKSFAKNAANAPDKHQQQYTTPSPLLIIQTTPETTSQAPTQAPTVTATENINQAETNKENAQVEEDEFINIFSTPVQERGETSS
ncbi:hypothetical protein Tco_1509893 [Tanacetum coccineum]